MTRPAPSVGDRPPEDLTARARIRDAAIRLFAERGIGAATIRDIAAAAGVSSGLIRHHFGNKEALRDACDAYVNERMDQVRQQMFAEGRLADQGFLTSVYPTARLFQSYLVRSMMDGSDAASRMFEGMVDRAERFLAALQIESADRRAHAAVLCAMQWGVFLMQDQLARVLEIDPDSVDGYVRINRGFVDNFAHTLLTPEQAAQLHAAMDQLSRASAGRQPPADSGARGAARQKGQDDDDRGDTR